MNQVEMQILIDKLQNLAACLYEEQIDTIEGAFRLDCIIDELNKILPYLESGL